MAGAWSYSLSGQESRCIDKVVFGDTISPLILRLSRLAMASRALRPRYLATTPSCPPLRVSGALTTEAISISSSSLSVSTLMTTGACAGDSSLCRMFPPFTPAGSCCCCCCCCCSFRCSCRCPSSCDLTPIKTPKLSFGCHSRATEGIEVTLVGTVVFPLLGACFFSILSPLTSFNQ